MHLVTLNDGGDGRPGVIVGKDIADLHACAAAVPDLGGLALSVRGILAQGDAALDRIRRFRDEADRPATSDRLRASGALVPREGAALLAPIPQPGVVLSIGRNYKTHSAEMQSPLAAPESPGGFTKSLASVIGPGAPIVLPRDYPDKVDWEAEFSGVIGRPCHNVSAAEALDYLVGYTIVNDVSARDWIPDFSKTRPPPLGPIEAWDRNRLGKQFPTFCPLGPSIATKDEVPDPEAVHLETRLNGQVMQSASTADLIFSLARIIEYYSRWYLFRPGDVITTGCPPGVGFARKPPIFMRAGDTIEVEASGVGILANPVEAWHPMI